MMRTLVMLPATIVVSATLTAWFRSLALRRRILDIPNARSSHVVPTPHGGGVAIVLVVIATLLIVSAGGVHWRGPALLTALCGAAVAIVGFMDDRLGLSQWKRLLVHVTAVAGLLFATRDLGPLDMPGLPDFPFLHALVAFLALVWLLNLFNFMDGIDGLAGMQAVFVSLGLAACLYVGPGASGSIFVLCFATAGASLGFLVFNWPPAKIFMGDVGSGFVGFLLGALAVMAHRESGLSAWVSAILLAAFATDATATLVRRMARGDRWYEAHRSHAYQQLSRRFRAHLPVTLGALLVNVLWLLPLAVAASRWTEWAGVFAAVAYAPLIPAMLWAGAGRAEVADGDR